VTVPQTLLGHLLESTRQGAQFGEPEFSGKTVARRCPRGLDHGTDARQGGRGVSRVRAQLLDHRHQDIKLPHRTDLLRDFLETTSRLMGADIRLLPRFSWFQFAWNIPGRPTIVEDAGTRYELPRAHFLELHEPEQTRKCESLYSKKRRIA
jgi:hypothetical protein